MKQIIYSLVLIFASVAFADPAEIMTTSSAFCSAYHSARECNADPSCYWVGALNRCAERATDCHIHGNQWACDQDPNCFWDRDSRSCLPRG